MARKCCRSFAFVARPRLEAHRSAVPSCQYRSRGLDPPLPFQGSVESFHSGPVPESVSLAGGASLSRAPEAAVADVSGVTRVLSPSGLSRLNCPRSAALSSCTGSCFCRTRPMPLSHAPDARPRLFSLGLSPSVHCFESKAARWKMLAARSRQPLSAQLRAGAKANHALCGPRWLGVAPDGKVGPQAFGRFTPAYTGDSLLDPFILFFDGPCDRGGPSLRFGSAGHGLPGSHGPSIADIMGENG